MHKFNSLFLLATSLVLTQLEADSYQEDSPPSQAQTNPLSKMGTNLSARPVVTDGCNLFLNGEFLYWQAVEDNIPYAIQGFDGSTSNGNPSKRRLKGLDHGWDAGFRISGGCNIPRDGWSLSLGWTSIRNNAKAFTQRVAAPSPTQSQFLYQAFGDANHQMSNGIFSARARLHVDLNQIDLQCGREFYYGKMLTLRPYIGARNAWVRQNFEVFTQNNTATLLSQLCKFHNNFWGFGFVGGVDTDWKFGSGFSLYSVSDLSILLGFFSVKEKIFFGLPPSNLSPVGTHIPSSDGMNLTSSWKNSLKEATAILDLALGLKWSGLFCKERFGVTIKAGYEYHLYLDQNHFFDAFAKNIDPSTNNLYVAQGGNLIYQGIAGSLQFDF